MKTESGRALPEVSFIIPCYRCRRTIGFTLKSIFSQNTEKSFEVLVVDSSGGEISDWIGTSFSHVRIIRSRGRLYPGAARNLGAECSKASMLAFIDADVVLAENWLETILSSYEAREDVGMISGAIINDNPESLPSRILYWIEFAEFLPGYGAGQRAALPSCNLVISRELFKRSGGFRDDLAMSEDFEFSHRVEGTHYFESAARVLHHHRSRWRLVVQHLRQLGYWSGRVRAEGAAPERSGVTSAALIPFLPFYRLLRILNRTFRSGYGEGLRAFLHTPFLAAGLIFWTVGFFQGSRSRKED